MKITDLFITTTPNASTEELRRWRDICNDILTLIHREPVFNPFADDVRNAIDGLDTDIESSIREDKIAERNREHDLREGRPNA